jgi:hypothetical protein
MAVAGLRVREPDAARDAQARTVGGAERRERQVEHESVPEGWLQVKKVSVKKIPVVTGGTRLGREQLLEANPHPRGEPVEASRAFPGKLGHHAGRDEHTAADLLEPDVQIEIAALRDANEPGAKLGRGRDSALLRARRS